MIICAGFPKTGSKSCSTALRKLGWNYPKFLVFKIIRCLGYEVADLMETVEFLAIPWSEYFDGKLTIEDILKAYEDHGFDANQDWPGNVRWEELYNASPKGTKVILTVRDNEEIWLRNRIHFFLAFNLSFFECIHKEFQEF